jgi:hypothetical protein
LKKLKENQWRFTSTTTLSRAFNLLWWNSITFKKMMMTVLIRQGVKLISLCLQALFNFLCKIDKSLIFGNWYDIHFYNHITQLCLLLFHSLNKNLFRLISAVQLFSLSRHQICIGQENKKIRIVMKLIEYVWNSSFNFCKNSYHALRNRTHLRFQF